MASGSADLYPELWLKLRRAGFSTDAKLLYVWGFSNKACNWAGLYEMDVETMSFDVGMTPNACESALEELAARCKMFLEDGVVFIPAKVKRCPHTGPNMAKGIRRAVDEIDPQHPLRVAWLQAHAERPWLKGAFDSVHVPERSVEPKPETLSQPSTDRSGTVQGRGKGKGEVGAEVEEQQAAVARVSELAALVPDVLEALRKGNWHSVDESSVENAIFSVMPKDNTLPLRAAYEAVEWSKSTGFNQRQGHRAFHSALRKFNEPPKEPQPEAPAAPTEHRCLDCDVSITEFQARNRSRRCDPCLERWEAKVEAA